MHVTDETFERDVLQRSAELPVVVEFWADWCAPCRLLAPVLERAVAARDGSVLLAKVDVDRSSGTADRYRVKGLPAVKAFRNGRVVAELSGVQRPTAVAQFLDRLVES